MSRDLLEDARAGDQAAFLRLLEPSLPRAICFLSNLGLRPKEAEERLSEAACALWRGRGTLKDAALGDSLLAWCAALGVRRLRGRGSHPAPPLPEPAPVLAGGGRWPGDGPLDPRVRRVIRAGVNELPLLHRVAFLLCDVDRLSPGAAARALHVSPQRLRTLRHEARVAMVAVIERAVGERPERG